MPDERPKMGCMNNQRRSPWFGLTGAQCIELDAYTAQPAFVALTPDQQFAHAHLGFARRAVACLVGGDLYGALSAAEIATAALRLTQRSSQGEREGQAVVDEYPPAAGRQGPHVLAWHGADAGSVAGRA